MTPAVQPLLAELDAEAPATRCVLERLPADRFGWRPHPKSMTVAHLRLLHVPVPVIYGRSALRATSMATDIRFDEREERAREIYNLVEPGMP